MVVLKTDRLPSAPRRLAHCVHLVLTPSHYDLLAACELQHGHTRAAERLAALAVEMRESRSRVEAQP